MAKARTTAPPAPAPPAARSRCSARSSAAGAFWILAATFFICGLTTNGLIQTHFIALCSDFDVGAVTAASTLAMMGVFDFVGTIGSGWLSDRYDNRALLFCYYGLRGLSLIYLPGSSFSIYGLSLFAVFYGLDWVATVPPTVRLTAQVFGRERAGVAFGWIFAAHMVGRGDRRLRRRLFAQRAADLYARALRRRRAVPRRRFAGLADRETPGRRAGAGARVGVKR